MTDHELRQSLNDELHARTGMALEAPALLTHLAFTLEDSARSPAAHVVALALELGEPAPLPNAVQIHLQLKGGFLRFEREFGAAHHMHDSNAFFLQEGRVRFGVSGRRKDDFHVFFHDDADDLFQIRIQHRHVYGERPVGRFPAFPDVLAQDVGIHGSGADYAQSAGVAYGAREFPSAVPDHAGLDDRVLYLKKFGNPVH